MLDPAQQSGFLNALSATLYYVVDKAIPCPSGFVCYQIAMRQPPHLKAIIPCYATDDRYTDDCHYRGGLFGHYYDVAAYGTMMVAVNALPPYPEYSGPDWARIWEQRLEHNTPYLLRWIKQQTDGPYWRPGSLRGQYDKVLCPTQG